MHRKGFLCGLVSLVSLAAWATDGPESVLKSGFVESGGEQIYYETVGQGEAVVFSHGLGGNHAIWYQQVPEFAKSYQVVTWDQRGFGRSTNEQEKSGPPAAVEDLKAILDHLEIGKAHLVGQSMGGWAVMGFALKYPERVRSVIMADTIGGIYTDEIAAHFDAYIRTVLSSPSPAELPFTQHPALGETFGASDPAQAFLYRQIGGLSAPPPANMGLLLRQTAYLPEDVKALDLPVLFVVGENDPIFPPNAIRAASDLVAGSRVVELPRAGHSPYFETPAAWNETVLAFLGELDE